MCVSTHRGAFSTNNSHLERSLGSQKKQEADLREVGWGRGGTHLWGCKLTERHRRLVQRPQNSEPCCWGLLLPRANSCTGRAKLGDRWVGSGDYATGLGGEWQGSMRGARARPRGSRARIVQVRQTNPLVSIQSQSKAQLKNMPVLIS